MVAGKGRAMDQQRFDRLTAAFVSGTGRRRALAALLAGTAAVFARGTDTTAKKCKKKKCTGCPQRACCSCRSVLEGPATKCITFEGVTSLQEAQDLCVAFCGQPALLFKFNFQVPGLANFCAADFDCTVESCPVPLNA
jgi:hypothetical protein